MLTSEFSIAFTQSAVTGTGIIFADGVSIFISIFVSDKLSDAHIAKFHSCTFDTVLVCFADCIECIDWWTMTWIRHWSITKDKTVASISPVFSFVKIRVVMTHHVSQLKISTITHICDVTIFTRATNSTGNTTSGYTGNTKSN